MQVLGEEEVLSGAGFLEGVFLDFLELVLVGVEDGEKCADVGASAGAGELAWVLTLTFMLAVFIEGEGRAAAAVFTTGS